MTAWAVRNQGTWNLEILTGLDHGFHQFLIGKDLLLAGQGALKFSIISLDLKEEILIKPSLGKLAIHIGGNDKGLLVLELLIELPVEGQTFSIAIELDMPSPISPLFLRTGKGIEG